LGKGGEYHPGDDMIPKVGKRHQNEKGKKNWKEEWRFKRIRQEARFRTWYKKMLGLSGTEWGGLQASNPRNAVEKIHGGKKRGEIKEKEGKGDQANEETLLGGGGRQGLVTLTNS